MIPLSLYLSFSLVTSQLVALTGYLPSKDEFSVELKLELLIVVSSLSFHLSSSLLEASVNEAWFDLSTLMLSTTTQPSAEAEESPNHNSRLTEVLNKLCPLI